MTESRFIPLQLDAVEPVEEYRPGGFHPIAIGDLFANERYRVIHKLGFGGSSTIWLARDQQNDPGRLVTLKAMRADVSSRPPGSIPELAIPRSLRAAFPDSDSSFQSIEDHFIVRGPNGSHLFLISPLAGPSIQALSECPGRVIGSRRLRGDLARKVAKETAKAIYCMHSAGWVHGDLTTSNILFRVSETVRKWSDAEVYTHLGSLETEEVRTRGGQPRGLHVPQELVAPIENSKFVDATFLQEDVVVIDFGQSYAIACPPSDYQPGTVFNYLSPETRFEGRTGPGSDVWGLGCAIFEIRAGCSLFDSFLGSDTDILRETVETLGRLPDPWWSSFEQRTLWFEEDGEPKSVEAQERANVFLKASKSSIREKLRSIGTQDDPPASDEGPMVEKTGARLDEEEVELLGDLLRKMLRYRPEERIGMQEVIEHSWFAWERGGGKLANTAETRN